MKQIKNLMINWLYVLTSPIWILPSMIAYMITGNTFVEYLIEGETTII